MGNFPYKIFSSMLLFIYITFSRKYKTLLSNSRNCLLVAQCCGRQSPLSETGLCIHRSPRCTSKQGCTIIHLTFSQNFSHWHRDAEPGHCKPPAFSSHARRRNYRGIPRVGNDLQGSLSVNQSGPQEQQGNHSPSCKDFQLWCLVFPPTKPLAVGSFITCCLL